MTDLEASIFAIAKEHGGRYLLANRYGLRSVIEKNVLEYEACVALVRSGRARWLPRNSSFWPGIELR